MNDMLSVILILTISVKLFASAYDCIGCDDCSQEWFDALTDAYGFDGAETILCTWIDFYDSSGQRIDDISQDWNEAFFQGFDGKKNPTCQRTYPNEKSYDNYDNTCDTLGWVQHPDVSTQELWTLAPNNPYYMRLTKACMNTYVTDHDVVAEFFANDYCTGYKTTDDSGELAQFRARSNWGPAQWTFTGHDDAGVRCDSGVGCELMSLRYYYANDDANANAKDGYGFKINIWPNYDYNAGQAYPYQQFWCDDESGYGYISDSIPDCALGGDCGTSISGPLSSSNPWTCLTSDDQIHCIYPEDENLVFGLNNLANGGLCNSDMSNAYVCNTIFDGPGKLFDDDVGYGELADYPLGSLYINFYDGTWGDNNVCSSAQYQDGVGYLNGFAPWNVPACADDDIKQLYLCIRFWKSDSWNPFDAEKPAWKDGTRGFAQYDIPMTDLCDGNRGDLVSTRDFFWVPADGGDSYQYGQENAWASYLGYGLYPDESCGGYFHS